MVESTTAKVSTLYNNLCKLQMSLVSVKAIETPWSDNR